MYSFFLWRFKESRDITGELLKLNLSILANIMAKSFGTVLTPTIETAVFDQAPSIEEFRTQEALFEDYPLGEALELPVGIFYREKEEQPFRRLRKLEINPDVASGEFEMLLEKAERSADRDIDKHVAKVSEYLSKAITAIDGVPFKDIARAVSQSPKDVVKRWYMGDVVMAIQAVRDVVQETRDYVSRTQCPCPKNEIIYDCPSKGRPVHSIDSLKFTYLEDLSGRPIYRVDLRRGFNDGRGDVKKIYIEPMKFFHSGVLAKRDDSLSMTVKMLREMVVGIPDSKVFGQKRGRVFDDLVFGRMHLRDRKLLERSVNQFQIGPELTFKVFCHSCMAGEATDDNVNWMVLTKNFIYDSADAPND